MKSTPLCATYARVVLQRCVGPRPPAPTTATTPSRTGAVSEIARARKHDVTQHEQVDAEPSSMRTDAETNQTVTKQAMRPGTNEPLHDARTD